MIMYSCLPFSLFFYGIACKHIILQKNKSQSMPCEIHIMSATMHVSVDLTFLFIHFMNETCPTWLHHCLGYVIYTHCTGGMCTQQILICHLRATAMPFIPIVLEKTLTLLLINDPANPNQRSVTHDFFNKNSKPTYNISLCSLALIMSMLLTCCV